MDLQRMWRCIVGFGALSIVSPFPATTAARAQQVQAPDVAAQLERADWLNSRCRDTGSADYCDVRDRAYEELKAKGWCWGQRDQPEYQKEWQHCERDPLLDMANKLMGQVDKEKGYVSNWKRVEAVDHIMVYFVDLSSLAVYTNGFREVIVFVADSTLNYFSARDLKRYAFDCHGRYFVNDPQFVLTISPYTVAAGLEAAVRLSDQKPSDYCATFTADACGRIRGTVESGERPLYCRRGFAMVGHPNNRDLTPEQLRICYVMGTWQ
jgi:hypothetical protein